MRRQSHLRAEQMNGLQPQRRFDQGAANSVHPGLRRAQPAPRSMRGGAIATLFEARFEATGWCAFSPPRPHGILPPVWRFTSLLPQLKRANGNPHLTTRYGTELPEFLRCQL